MIYNTKTTQLKQKSKPTNNDYDKMTGFRYDLIIILKCFFTFGHPVSSHLRKGYDSSQLSTDCATISQTNMSTNMFTDFAIIVMILVFR